MVEGSFSFAHAKAPRKGWILTKSAIACSRAQEPKPVLPASIICNGFPITARRAVVRWAGAVRP